MDRGAQAQSREVTQGNWSRTPACTKVLAVFFFLVATNSSSVAQTSKEVARQDPKRTEIARVYVELEGDPKLVHRLFTFLDFAFEDNGIFATNTAEGAEAVIRANLKKQPEKVNIGLGIVRVGISASGKQEKTDDCATLNSEENGELSGGGAAKGAVEELRLKYPTARTVKIDGASEMTESKVFSSELPRSLTASGFDVIQMAPADLELRVNLVREKIPVDENTVKYELSVSARDGSLMLSETGSGVLTAKLAGRAPEACPNRLADLDWLVGEDPLFRLARRVTKALRDPNVRPRPFN